MRRSRRRYCACIAFEGDAGGLKDGKYHHLVATYDKITMRLYVDGEIAKVSVCAASLSGNDASLEMGIGLRGQLDEVAIYDRVLPAPNVKRHFGAGSGR